MRELAPGRRPALDARPRHRPGPARRPHPQAAPGAAHLSVRAQALLGRHRDFCSRCRARARSLPATLFTDPGVDTDRRRSCRQRRPCATRFLAIRLRDLFEELSGIAMADVAGASPFVEIGLDSLTLTQAAIQVKKQFKVNLSFRQLMESYRSFDALAEFLDANLPPDPVAAAATVAPTSAAAIAVRNWPPSLGRQRRRRRCRGRPGRRYAGAAGDRAADATDATATRIAVGGARRCRPALGCRQRRWSNLQPMATAAATASTSPAAADAEEPAPLQKYDVKKAFGAIARIHTQSKETDRTPEGAAGRLRAPLHRAHGQEQGLHRTASPADGRSPRRQRLPAGDQGDHLPDRGRALQGLAALGPRRQRIRRRAQRLRHEPVRLAARLHQRCGARPARSRLRDRAAASVGRRGLGTGLRADRLRPCRPVQYRL